MAHLKRDTCDMDDLVERTGALRASIVGTRTEVRARSIEVLRTLERAVREALAGDTLRGMRSLLPADCTPFRAAAVYGTRDHGVDSFLSALGKPMLVWTKQGELHSAWKVGREAASRAVTDDELTAQDLEAATVALETVLMRHLEHSDDTLRSYRSIGDLCTRIARALDD